MILSLQKISLIRAYSSLIIIYSYYLHFRIKVKPRFSFAYIALGTTNPFYPLENLTILWLVSKDLLTQTDHLPLLLSVRWYKLLASWLIRVQYCEIIYDVALLLTKMLIVEIF